MNTLNWIAQTRTALANGTCAPADLPFADGSEPDNEFGVRSALALLDELEANAIDDVPVLLAAA